MAAIFIFAARGRSYKIDPANPPPYTTHPFGKGG